MTAASYRKGVDTPQSERVRLAKRFAAAHGYRLSGTHVLNAQGAAIARGWREFYREHARTIVRWAERNGV